MILPADKMMDRLLFVLACWSYPRIVVIMMMIMLDDRDDA